MFDGDFGVCSLKWAIAGQPFVYHDAQRILVAGGTRVRLYLFGGHVGDGTRDILGILVRTALRGQRDAKIA